MHGKVIDSVEGQRYLILLGGIGFEVYSPVVLETGSEITLYITTILRQDSIKLFGFRDRLSKAMFDSLIKLSGIGPIKALEIMAKCKTEHLLDLILLSNLEAIEGCKISASIAKKLVHELPSILLKSQIFQKHVPNPHKQGNQGGISDVKSALLRLGYTQHEIETALLNITVDGENESTEHILRKALARISK